MKTDAIIQVRMSSSRLPGKVMMKVDSKHPVLYYVITQLQFSKNLDEIIVATSTREEDDIIADYVKNLGVICFRGSLKDVLDRYYQCAKEFSIKDIVRITSDCPLIDPTIVDKVIEKFKSNSFDVVTNSGPITGTFPQGTDVEVFSFQALEKAWKKAKKPSEREHVTAYFYNNESDFKIDYLTRSENISHLRWCVDGMPDLELVRKIVSKINKKPILMRHILDLFSKEPHLQDINKNHIVNEGALKSLEEDKKAGF